MRKRKGSSKSLASSASASSSTSSSSSTPQEHGFFACYLLASLNPRFKGHTYIGFTVNPRRRIRQHNGEIGCGAWRTKKKRPWEMVLCIYGFPTNVAALQFEWAWQHPVESLAVRKAAANFKSLSGVANKIKLAYTMLTLPSWQSMNMTVNFFSTKYMKHCAGCPSLPEHMTIEMGEMDELPCYTGRIDGLVSDNDDIDEGEFGKNNSNSDIVPDMCGGVSIAQDSDQNNGDKISESIVQNQKSEAAGEATTDPLASQDSSDSIMLPATGEDTNLVSAMNNGGSNISDGLSQSECDQPLPATSPKRVEIIVMNESNSCAVLAANNNNNQESRRMFLVPHEAEIIDLSTPSPSCSRRVLDSNKKRRVSSSLCVGADFIDLTKSPNFVQL
ncbi:hypothetical protein HN51_061233 [Arachis hypogaea]|uniref:Structure-specific endonuclease subunit SLX1 homolog n=1 Tax=Arachis hypogaea TaxID=3818 RepID=A0A445AMR1_ARAHY|nr:uncharacterized protein LOC107642765 [Arachis ipaensis]XP_025626417.1 uncharacterized protein LOC112719898 [Arachis hypogaea]QHO18428.1 Structure-specific endonuclease subunit [Arachis hypogaea]RYR27630.1 hypothetical protein Ahy_B01g051642 [Arachis hypogaea]